MRRRLLIVNLALAAAAAAGLWRLRVEYRRAGERYRILTPAHAATPPPAGRTAEPPAAGPVQAAAYLDVAEKFLFHPDRNATVVIEHPKAKPRPALPQLFGVMKLGGDPIAIMAVGPNNPHKTVRLGEMIGEFKLLAAAGDQITLEWEGQAIESQVSDLLVRAAPEVRGGGALAAPATSAGSAGATLLNPAAESQRPGEYKIGPAAQGATGTIYQALPGDNAPHGTVYQGKRKVVRTTPFGTQSWWEDVKQ